MYSIIEKLMPVNLTPEFSLQTAGIKSRNLILLLPLLALLLINPSVSIGQNTITAPDLAITNTPSASVFTQAGDIINYAISVKNTGTVPVFNINVSDPKAELKSTSVIESLMPGEAISLTAAHKITQADLDEGKLVNVVSVAGIGQDGNPVEKSGRKVFILGLQRPGLRTTVTSSAATFEKEGDPIEYTIRVENTGNITMNDIEVLDEGSSPAFNGTIASLAPGAADSIRAVYRITTNDIYAGRIVNSGLARAVGANNQLYAYPANETGLQLAIENFNLSNFPNPFDRQTTIVFDLPESSLVVLKIFDQSGREVGQVDGQEFNEGRNYINWEAGDHPAGFYFLKMYCNGNQAVRRMVITN